MWHSICLCLIKKESKQLEDKKQRKKSRSVKDEAMSIMNIIERKLEFEGEYNRLERKTLSNDWRQTW